MPLTALTPMLWVDDLEVTIAFYRDVLGFECPVQTDGWATLRRDGVELMICLPNRHEPYEHPLFTGSLYFRVDDAASIWLQLQDKAKVVYPIEDFEYGMREFAVRDNNGYILQFGQELA